VLLISILKWKTGIIPIVQIIANHIPIMAMIAEQTIATTEKSTSPRLTPRNFLKKVLDTPILFGTGFALEEEFFINYLF